MPPKGPATARENEDASAVNLYETLALAPTASTADIKRAYKILALKLHPDKLARQTNLSADERAKASETFQRVALAYEILSDDIKRTEYDARCELNGAKKDDVLVNVSSKEAITGATKLAMVPFKLVCAQCNGVGMACARCAACDGKGEASCGGCEGKGFGAPAQCTKCKGDGVVDDYFHGRVHVPAGCENGTRLPISGRSQHVRVRILPSKQFTRDGLNVTSTLTLSAKDAAEGGFFEVETVYGIETTYFDEDTKSGDTKVLDGKGIKDGKKVGDHTVRVEVERAPTPDVEVEPEIEAAEDEEENEAEEPPAKKSKVDEPDTEMSLEELLAAKKAKLLAQLEAAATK